jgi:hypothetical protein
MSRLSYHQNVFDLLDCTPAISKAAVRRIEKSEKRCGQRLPAAVRDWYVREKVVPLTRIPRSQEEFGYLWHDYSNDDHPVALEDVLAAFEEVVAGDAEKFVEVLIENQGCAYWFFEVDDSDDPPVWVRPEREDGDSQELENAHFSDFTFGWMSRYSAEDWTPTRLVDGRPSWLAGETNPDPKPHANGLWLRSPREGVLLPPYIDQLVDQMEEGPRQEWEGRLTTYHFRTDTARLRVTTDHWDTPGGRSAWWLHGDSGKALAEMARRVWHVGTLAETLRCGTEEGKAVLERLRGGAASC